MTSNRLLGFGNFVLSEIMPLPDVGETGLVHVGHPLPHSSMVLPEGPTHWIQPNAIGTEEQKDWAAFFCLVFPRGSDAASEIKSCRNPVLP